MGRYGSNLPQLKDDLFVTDGGIETTLIFLEGHELPYFAAFDLLKSAAGTAALQKYFRTYANLARQYGRGCILESATWRANPDWGAKLGYTTDALAAVNRQAVEMLHEIRRELETPKSPMVISGCIGPRGDGYNPASLMKESEAEEYHALQAQAFRAADADLVTAITMTHATEAIGLARAAKTAGLPVVLSFTVETDGTLPSGQSLREAIGQVDAATASYPSYYMINCAHPTHFEQVVSAQEPWVSRIRGVRANASKRSHAELDSAPDLDAGNPVELARQYRDLKTRLPKLNVVGGCCGTDHRHLEEICKAFA